MERFAHESPVGRVVGLWRYPVKSMGAETLSEVDVSWHGLTGDRRWAFVRDGVVSSGFPWLTLRQRSDMNLFRPSFVDPTQPEKSAVRVQTPTDERLDLTDRALIEALGGDGIRLIKQNRGIFDTFPISLISIQTIAELAKRVERPLDVQRFRPNLLVEATSGQPFEEDRWVGAVVTIGTVAMRVDKRDGRCAVINLDPKSCEREPAILRTVAQERDGCLGVYGSTVTPGRIELNDTVLLEPGSRTC